jgi:predicted MFS family arabinose efflux permease
MVQPSSSSSVEGATDRAGISDINSSGTRAWPILILIALVTLFASADRNVLAVLLVPVQAELMVSDAAMGALTGIAFSLVYATIALPAARLADNGNRRKLISLALAFWSVMTVVCGLAVNYASFALGRIGVAAGEAVAQPSQMSMIGDLFPARSRGTALSIMAIGGALGVSVGALVAGVINDHFGWRAAFMVLAVPGVLTAILFYLVVPEPVRGLHDGGDVPELAGLSWKQSLSFLWNIKTMRGLLSGMIFSSIASYGYLAWLPTFLIRVHHMTTTQMSFWFAISVGVGSILSNAIGGYLSDRLVKRGARWRLYMLATVMILGTPFLGVIAFASNLVLVIAAILALAFFNGVPGTLSYAVGMDVVPSRMRGTMTSVMGFMTMVLGAGLGPFLFGLLSDGLSPTFGADSLRYVLLSVALCKLASVVCFLSVSGRVDCDAASMLKAQVA